MENDSSPMTRDHLLSSQQEASLSAASDERLQLFMAA